MNRKKCLIDTNIISINHLLLTKEDKAIVSLKDCFFFNFVNGKTMPPMVNNTKMISMSLDFIKLNSMITGKNFCMVIIIVRLRCLISKLLIILIYHIWEGQAPIFNNTPNITTIIMYLSISEKQQIKTTAEAII